MHMQYKTPPSRQNLLTKRFVIVAAAVTTVLTASLNHVSAIHPKDSSVGSSGLLAFYKMNEKSGPIAKNSVSNDKHAVLYNNTFWTTGRYKGGLGFGRPTTEDTSLSDFAQAEGPFDFSTNEVTLSTWFRHNGNDWQTNWQAIMSDPECCNYRMLLYPGGHPYINAGQHADWYLPEITLQPNTWYHIALTIKGGGYARLYIDGTKVAEQNEYVPAQLPNATALALGSGERTSGYFYSLDGKLDDVRVYNRELSRAEIVNDMRKNAGEQEDESGH